MIDSNKKRIQELRLMGFATQLQLSAQMELLLEIIVMRELNLTVAQTSIVCAPLGGGAKTSLACSLATLSGSHPEMGKAVSTFQRLAGRNAMAHGFLFPTPKAFLLVSREVKNKLAVKIRNVDTQSADELCDAFEAVQAASGVSDDDIHQYGKEIVSLAPTLESLE